jgi:hypothetical protein
MADSTSAEKNDLAALSGASLSHLYDLGTGRRNASSDLAGRIEIAIRAINKRRREQPLPIVRRGDIAEACANCPFYKKECK